MLTNNLNRDYIRDYDEQMRIAKTYFPELYELYRNGTIIIAEVYLDTKTNKYHILYKYNR